MRRLRGAPQDSPPLAPARSDGGPVGAMTSPAPGEDIGASGRATPWALLRITAVLEGVTAVALLVFPALPIRLLLGHPPRTEMASLGARLAGAALLVLAIACWRFGGRRFTRRSSALVVAIGLYDVLAAGLLISLWAAFPPGGALLWPAAALHVALGFWSAATVFGRKPGGQ